MSLFHWLSRDERLTEIETVLDRHDRGLFDSTQSLLKLLVHVNRNQQDINLLKREKAELSSRITDLETAVFMAMTWDQPLHRPVVTATEEQIDAAVNQIHSGGQLTRIAVRK